VLEFYSQDWRRAKISEPIVTKSTRCQFGLEGNFGHYAPATNWSIFEHDRERLRATAATCQQDARKSDFGANDTKNLEMY